MADEAEVQQRGNEVDRLIMRKEKVNALVVALQNTSITSASDKAKVWLLFLLECSIS